MYTNAQGLGARAAGGGGTTVGPHGGVYYTTRQGVSRHAAPARVHTLAGGRLAFQPHPKLHPGIWRVIPSGPNPGGPNRPPVGVAGLGQAGQDLSDFFTGVTSWFSPS